VGIRKLEEHSRNGSIDERKYCVGIFRLSLKSTPIDK
jgi:hypothetical protein